MYQIDNQIFAEMMRIEWDIFNFNKAKGYSPKFERTDSSGFIHINAHELCICFSYDEAGIELLCSATKFYNLIDTSISNTI